MKRITILIGAMAALMLVPAAQAFAEEANVKVNIVGSGSGEVHSVAFAYIAGPGTPPIACTYNGTSQSGECENTPDLYEGEEGYYLEKLTATATGGSELVGWTVDKGYETGECPGIFGPSTCLLYNEEEEKEDEWEVTVEFAAAAGPPLVVEIEEGKGTVVSNPAGISCSGEAPKSCETGSIAEGEHVTLTASPANGYLFKSWKNCDSGGVNGRQCTITLTPGHKPVIAKFVRAFELTGSKSNPNGILNTSPGGVNCGYGCLDSKALYKEGSVTVKSKPAKHFHFVEFTNGGGSAAACSGVTTETCSFTIAATSTIEEVYEEDAKNTLSLTKVGGGQGFVKTKPTAINCGYTCKTARGEFFASEEVPVTVTLGKGTSEVTWTASAGTCTGHALSCTVPMSGTQVLEAEFK